MKLIDQHARNRLVIYHQDIQDRELDAGLLEQHLQQIGFAQDGNPGPGFMKLLTFMGCSPSVGSGNAENDYNRYSVEYCFGDRERVLITSSRIKAPSCRECGQKSDAPAVDLIENWSGQTVFRCPFCKENIPIQDIKWQHRLAEATDYIVVHGVFEGEVVPSDRLLDRLAKITGTSWSYCYC